MTTKLSFQKEIIVSSLRDLKFHCGREWVDRIKDDRKRIQELNEGYMLEKGFEIKGEPCKGTACGRRGCPLFKRRAVKLGATANAAPQQNTDRAKMLEQNKQRVLQFDREYSQEHV